MERVLGIGGYFMRDPVSVGAWYRDCLGLDADENGLWRQGAVGFQNSATGLDLGCYAARSYSLMRPPRTGRSLIRSWPRFATGWAGRGGRSPRPRWGRCPL